MTLAIKTGLLTKKYKQNLAVQNVTISIQKGEIFGLLGPDGAGKTTLTKMLCSVLLPTSGTGTVAGHDIVRDNQQLRGKIGYMSEGFSLYGSLSVDENIEFFADMYQVSAADREIRKKKLLAASRLDAFTSRKADHLSGGMKKKLALCCTLIYQPEIIFLDEPTTGVDPLSRRDFWNILHDYVTDGTTVFVCTPYMDEAERFHRVALMHEGEVIAVDTPYQIKQEVAHKLKKQSVTLEEAFIFHIEQKLVRKQEKEIQKVEAEGDQKEKMVLLKNRPKIRVPHEEIAVEVNDLTRTFGSFTAVNHINFSVQKGEIFGFLGPNGSGKSTTIRMMCGLLPVSAGNMHIAGVDVRRSARLVKKKIGYMSQKFSLYNDLTVEENIRFFAGAYGLNKKEFENRKAWILEMSDLVGKERLLTSDLSGGWKQRLALGCATIHQPEILFLDEPTSGVDPIARRQFWNLINHLAAEGVTVFVTTHYMDEAEHCDRIGFIFNSNLIAIGSPEQLKDELFAGYLLELECDWPFAAQKWLSDKGVEASVFGNGLHVFPTGMSFVEVVELVTNEGFHIRRQSEIPVSMEDVFVKLVEKQLKREEVSI
ncbi:ATP-binding cassette domain-containing protein [Neobacillus sp. SM06]|uniref:ATP-binding cassette domain-containing protein n=1 Tax=Neobacillus sp. SM06 TaxID=3422492 RepID=UPI003D2686FF